MTENRIMGPQADITLADIISRVKTDIGFSLNCVQIGKIEDYNYTTNMAKVSINFKRMLANGDIYSYPLLEDVPVFILAGGGAYIGMPIAPGDQCILLFNDRNIENWFLDGSVDVPSDSRTHSIADAIAIVGIQPLNAPKIHPANAICINGNAKKVAVKNAATDLKTLIDSLIDTLMGAQHTVGGATGAPWPVFGATGIAALTSVKSQFATLLSTGA
jgi:hypothetical protein